MPTPRAQALRSIPLFADLDARERELLARNLDELSFPAGTTLIDQGKSNHTFFILIEGAAEVAVSGQPKRTLGPGDFFGEISMEHRVGATASVVTTTPVHAYVMSHAQFGAVGTSPVVLARLRAAMTARLLSDRNEPGASRLPDALNAVHHN
jgi:CRP/FNR family transcriptional regulator, cyclic AMP receptor protein